MTVGTLKKTLAESKGLDQQDLRFIWSGKQLADGMLVFEKDQSIELLTM
jgi:hypothetical protein